MRRRQCTGCVGADDWKGEVSLQMFRKRFSISENFLIQCGMSFASFPLNSVRNIIYAKKLSSCSDSLARFEPFYSVVSSELRSLPA
jgi:hypothetical protein